MSSKSLKFAAFTLAILLALIFLVTAATHCQAKVTADVPGETLCKAELDAPTIARFQKFLIQFGHDQLKIIEGTAFGTAKGIRQKTFVVVLKCVDKDCNVYAVGVSFVKDNLDRIEIKPTGERMPEI